MSIPDIAPMEFAIANHKYHAVLLCLDASTPGVVLRNQRRFSAICWSLEFSRKPHPDPSPNTGCKIWRRGYLELKEQILSSAWIRELGNLNTGTGQTLQRAPCGIAAYFFVCLCVCECAGYVHFKVSKRKSLDTSAAICKRGKLQQTLFNKGFARMMVSPLNMEEAMCTHLRCRS